MPELPEMQVYRDRLDAELRGAKLLDFGVSREKKVDSPLPAVKKALEGQKLETIERMGKELVFNFDNGDALGVHLMIAGRFSIAPTDEDPPNARVGWFDFDGGKTLNVTDRAGFAKFKFNPEPIDVPDALSDAVDADFLRECFAQTPRANIRAFLMDQARIMGIGGSNSDEILWASKIAPQSKCGAIPDEKVEDLAKAIHEVLSEGVKRISALDNPSDYREARVSNIHDPKKKTSPTGGEIKSATTGGRKGFYTDEQVLYT